MARLETALLAIFRKGVAKVAEDYEEIQEVISDYPSGYTPKGTVASATDLPDSGNETGDFYWVTDEDNAEYFWDGTAWQKKMTAITNAQIDALYD